MKGFSELNMVGLGDSIDSVNITIVSLLSQYDIANLVITIKTTCILSMRLYLNSMINHTFVLVNNT